MSSRNALAPLLRAIRMRQFAASLLLALPWLLVAIAAAWRWQATMAGTFAVVIVLAAVLGFAVVRARRFDGDWLARSLDAASPLLEDSSALLLRHPGELTAVEVLQRRRIETKYAQGAEPPIRVSLPKAALAGSWLASAAAAMLCLWWPVSPGVERDAVGRSSAAVVRGAAQPTIRKVRLRVTPPAYTGLPTREVAGLDASAPVGSTLRWSIAIAPTPAGVALAMHKGKPLPMTLQSGLWSTGLSLQQSFLYRVATAAGPAITSVTDARMHRIDAIRDRVPRIRIVQPSRPLNIAAPAQRTLDLAFVAADDYGISRAWLAVTLAQGSGENIGVRSSTIPVSGSGPAIQRRFAHSLDIRSLGMQAGDDLIVQLHVLDTRRPDPQSARSASVILRWPPPGSAGDPGLEGLVQRVLPAYFRSQRQIIIDSEALLAERGKLAPAAFVEKSDTIGVDQRLLRLRYGQFLGEESEDSARLPARAGESGDGHAAGDPLFADSHAHSDDAAAARESNSSGREESASAGQSPVPQAPHADESAHAHDESSASGAFGDAGAVVAEFGHAHDIAEAATLLDPATQKLLRGALGEMWQAELHLRQGFPDRALPFERRALELIKQVQQADRIYLARVGLELPPIDPSRRLTGKRDGMRNRSDPLERVPVEAAALRRLWEALGRQATSASRDDLLEALAEAEEWLLSRGNTPAPAGFDDGDAPEIDTASTEGGLPDTLDVVAAIDALRRTPGCVACLHRLRATLWPLLPESTANVLRRQGDTGLGRVYLDALARERGPTP